MEKSKGSLVCQVVEVLKVANDGGNDGDGDDTRLLPCININLRIFGLGMSFQ